MSFNQIMQAGLKPGFQVPDALEKLYDWIDINGFADQYTYKPEVTFGVLAPLDILNKREPILDEYDKELAYRRGGGSGTLFAPDLNEGLHHWFGVVEDDTRLERVCAFAKTGGEGSMAALWLDDDAHQHIVHVGSGSGSVLTCILATDPIDFLRLNAIGYDELCWDDTYDAPPNANWKESGVFVEPYKPFQTWVRETFGVTIPQTAREIVAVTPSMDSEPPTGDAFCDWVAGIPANS